MSTLLFFGPTKDGQRDSYLVAEEFDAVVAAMNSESRFVPLTDNGDGATVWFRVDSIRYFYEN